MPRLVFIDESPIEAKFVKRAYWAPREERHLAELPFGGWKLQPLIADQRCHVVVVSWIVGRAMNRQIFKICVQTQLARPRRNTT